MGEEAGWKYMDALHQNIAQYIHSGSAPCVQAAKGERLIGIGLDMRGASEKTKGAPIDLIVPKEGLGWELEATAIVKGTKNLDAAKKLADWAVTKKANELYAKTYAVVALPDVKAAPVNYPVNAEPGMIKNDMEWMAKNRERILAEWTKRYDGKSALRSDPHRVTYLEVRSLSKRYGDFTALGDITLDIAEGEFVCFLGPSGCGKTTLLRAIAGLDPQSSGTIRQKGRTCRRCRRPSATSALSSSPTRSFPT